MLAIQKKSKVKKNLNSLLVTSLATVLLLLFLMPFGYMVITSIKTQNQFMILGSPFYPAVYATFTYNGTDTNEYSFEYDKSGRTAVLKVNMADYVGEVMDVYKVPLETGTKNLALVKGLNAVSVFIDPAKPDDPPFLWVGYYKSLDRPWKFAPSWSNYVSVWNDINYPRILWNTVFYAATTTVGILFSSILVAFGFSRFRFPGRDFMFVLMISTIFLPGAVTIIPQFTFFTKIGWVGTWLPLIVPSFFANAYDTFLLRQFFMTLPRELDEAAMIDGATPLRVLWSVILPQSYAAIVAVSVFHIVWAWNDYFGPLIYLSTKMDSQPVSVALARFNGIYGQQPQMIQAGALMTIVIPMIIFFLAQRFFVQGIVITGVEK